MATPERDDYAAALATAKAAIQSAQTRAVLAVSSEMIGLYWDLGRLILERQSAEGPRTRVVARLSADLRAEFPSMKGLSVGNLDYMRRLAAAWPDRDSSLQLIGKIPWGHNQTLLDKLADRSDREWYARSAIEHGWSRAVLENQVMSQLKERTGTAPTNFERLLPAHDSELMQQATKDPYHLEFLGLDTAAKERDIEQAMIDQLDRFLRELGQGFAYVGRQWRLEVDGDEFFVDLLMFHANTNRYVVIELKNRKLAPADVGQLNFYVAVLDDTLRREHHNPTVGLLLCTSANERTVRYALDASTSPMAVSGYRYADLPLDEQQVLPAESELLEVVAGAAENEPSDSAQQVNDQET